MLDQSPVAIFEKSRDNDTLLGYTERIRDILTDYQVFPMCSLVIGPIINIFLGLLEPFVA